MAVDNKSNQSAVEAHMKAAREILTSMRSGSKESGKEDELECYRDWSLRLALLRWELERDK